MEKGKLIVIEGTDCSGKETQAKLLVEKLNKKNLNTKHLSFPCFFILYLSIKRGCAVGCVIPYDTMRLSFALGVR